LYFKHDNILQEKATLAKEIPNFPICIGLIENTLVNIHKPYNTLTHKSWLNGKKKAYSMNNIVVLDHHGLFIYLDLGYPR
jgi:hypothetical protein